MLNILSNVVVLFCEQTSIADKLEFGNCLVRFDFLCCFAKINQNQFQVKQMSKLHPLFKGG